MRPSSEDFESCLQFRKPSLSDEMGFLLLQWTKAHRHCVFVIHNENFWSVLTFTLFEVLPLRALQIIHTDLMNKCAGIIVETTEYWVSESLSSPFDTWDDSTFHSGHLSLWVREDGKFLAGLCSEISLGPAFFLRRNVHSWFCLTDVLRQDIHTSSSG